MTRTRGRQFARSWTIFWALVLGAGFILSTLFSSVHLENVGIVFDAIAAIALACILIPWVVWFLVQFYRAFNANLTAAMTPVPSPAEISWRLTQEWGRPATVEEVAAVHQMLISEHNQALLAMGITLGAIYLMDKNLHK